MLATVVGVSPDPLQSDLEVEIVTPLLVSNYLLGNLWIRSLCRASFQKSDHHIDSRKREFHLRKRHRFPHFCLFICSCAAHEKDAAYPMIEACRRDSTDRNPSERAIGYALIGEKTWQSGIFRIFQISRPSSGDCCGAVIIHRSSPPLHCSAVFADCLRRIFGALREKLQRANASLALRPIQSAACLSAPGARTEHQSVKRNLFDIGSVPQASRRRRSRACAAAVLQSRVPTARIKALRASVSTRLIIKRRGLIH
jgi:hypothetical protein